MRRFSLLLGVLGATAAFSADRQIVKGELRLGRDDVRGTVLECGTNREIEVGVMASSQYFHYASQHHELSGAGEFGVLVEMSGRLRSTISAGRKLVMESPRILAMTRGNCVGSTPNPSLERTREG
jgi:hypothetical protein